MCVRQARRCEGYDELRTIVAAGAWGARDELQRVRKLLGLDWHEERLILRLCCSVTSVIGDEASRFGEA